MKDTLTNKDTLKEAIIKTYTDLLVCEQRLKTCEEVVIDLDKTIEAQVEIITNKNTIIDAKDDLNLRAESVIVHLEGDNYALDTRNQNLETENKKLKVITLVSITLNTLLAIISLKLLL